MSLFFPSPSVLSWSFPTTTSWAHGQRQEKGARWACWIPSAKATWPVQWKENTLWMDHLVAYLLENVSVWLKLFSDSTQEAQEEGQFKVCWIIFRCQSSTYPSLLLIRSVMGSQSNTTTWSSLELSLIWRRSQNVLIIQPILHSISQLSRTESTGKQQTL